MVTDNNASMLIAPSNRTLSDYVADRLREAILTGHLKPGQRIVEHEIAEAMQVSRGPVRDALRELESERLVARHPHKGTFVAWLNLRDAEEIYSLREALEGLAVAYAIKYATDEQLAELDEIVSTMVARRGGNYTQQEATDIDLEFHDTLCRISGHSRVLMAWRAVRAQVRLLILSHRTLQPADFRERAVDWHQQLATALRQRDVDLARAVLHTHLTQSFQSVAEAFKRASAGAAASQDEHNNTPLL